MKMILATVAVTISSLGLFQKCTYDKEILVHRIVPIPQICLSQKDTATVESQLLFMPWQWVKPRHI